MLQFACSFFSLLKKLTHVIFLTSGTLFPRLITVLSEIALPGIRPLVYV